MFRKTLLAALFLLAMIVPGERAMALSCAPVDASPSDIVSSRDYIFYGSALHIDEAGRSVRVRVTRTIKGSLGSEVVLKGTVWDTYHFLEDKENLLLFDENQYDAGTATFQKTDCDFYDSITPDREEFPAFAALVEQTPKNNGSVWIPIMLGGILALGTAFWFGRRSVKRRR